MFRKYDQNELWHEKLMLPFLSWLFLNICHSVGSSCVIICQVHRKPQVGTAVFFAFTWQLTTFNCIKVSPFLWKWRGHVMFKPGWHHQLNMWSPHFFRLPPLTVFLAISFRFYRQKLRQQHWRLSRSRVQKWRNMRRWSQHLQLPV